MKFFAGMLFAVVAAFAAPAQAQVQDEIRGLFNIFVRESNAHNVAAVGQMLHDSRDFLWVAPRGAAVTGRDAALQSIATAYRGTWRIEPEFAALKITLLGDSALRLHVPVRLTVGEMDKPPQSEPYLLTQVYVKTPLGWRISSVVPAPLQH
jgi:hypothetical protein